ncbi:MAG: phage integrase N-terminal SAM-like domain-containing protein, partial [Terracidiphilus sp.]
MTHLRRIMLEELQRRNYADSTARYYVRAVEQFARHFGKSPDKLGLEHLRTYQAYLLKQRKVGRRDRRKPGCRTAFLLRAHAQAPRVPRVSAVPKRAAAAAP